MKKVVSALFTAMLVIVLAFAVSGCSKADGVKKAFEDEGYTVSTVTVKDSESAKSALSLLGLTKEQINEAGEWEVISAAKLALTSPALILKFPSSGKVKEFLTVEKEDGTKDTSIYDKAKESGKINGDCLLLVGEGNAKEIFKKA